MSTKKIIIGSVVFGILIVAGAYFNENYEFKATQTSINNKKSKEELSKELLKAMENNWISEAKQLIDDGADYYYTAEDGLNLFTKAFYLANDGLIDHMISKGADIKKVQVSNNCIYQENTIKAFEKYGINTKNTLNTYVEKNKPSESGNPRINGFEILEHKGENYITGKIKNTNNSSFSSVYININILDTNGNVINSTIDSINNLQVGQTWSFKAPVTVNQTYRYEIMDIKGYK